MSSNIAAGIIVTTEFCNAGDAVFSKYINYIDRKEARKDVAADKTSLFDRYIDYMDNSLKASGLFTKNCDALDADQKAKLKEIYGEAQKNDSLMWETVISFDTEYLKELGLYNSESGLREKEIKVAARKAINKMLENEGLQNSVWSASFHYNTQHFHIHVATVEPTPMREKKLYRQYEKEKVNGKWEYKLRFNAKSGKKEKVPILDKDGTILQKLEYKGKFSQKSIDMCKSELRRELDQNKDTNIEISSIIREKILGNKKEMHLLEDMDFKNKCIDLYEKLPKTVSKNLWKYNTSIMKAYRKEIDDLSTLFIEKYHKEDFERLQVKLEHEEAEFKKAYGGSNNFKDKKIKDLYSRLGNSILKELRAYDSNIKEKSKREKLKPNDEQIANSIIDNIEHHEENVLPESIETKAESESNMLIQPDILPDFLKKETKGYYKWSDDYKKAKKLMFVKRDYQNAYNLLILEAQKGNALAMYDLGEVYRYGRGREINLQEAANYYEEALKIFMKSVKGADSFAFSFLTYRIGKMYNYGMGTEKNPQEACKWFEKSSQTDNPYAAYALANLYFSGEGVEKNISKAVDLYKMAASKNPYAAYKLGDIYFKGLEHENLVIKQDKDIAQGYYKNAFKMFQSMLNDVPDDNLQYRIGTMYMKGLGTDKNIDMAKELFEKASDLGNPYAAYALAKIYLQEAEPSSELVDKAIKLLEKAAYKGKNDAAKYALGKIYMDATYEKKDVSLAIKLLDEVKENNSMAAYALGKIYSNEENLCFDIDKSIYYFCSAAEQDNEFAQYALGKIYTKEAYFDEAKAIFWLTKAADAGNVYAQYSVGKLLTNTESENFSAQEGLKYLHQAAEQENQFAELKIGLLYLKGEVLPRDIDKAKEWFKRSHEHGNDFAAEVLNNMAIPESQQANKFTKLAGTNGFVKSSHDIDTAIRFLRKSMNRAYEAWKNKQEYEELQNEISRPEGGLEL